MTVDKLTHLKQNRDKTLAALRKAKMPISSLPLMHRRLYWLLDQFDAAEAKLKEIGDVFNDDLMSAANELNTGEWVMENLVSQLYEVSIDILPYADRCKAGNGKVIRLAADRIKELEAQRRKIRVAASDPINLPSEILKKINAILENEDGR